MESQLSTTTNTIPPVFPCSLLGYGTTAVSMPDLKMEIVWEHLSKKTARQVLAVARLQAAACGLLACR